MAEKPHYQNPVVLKSVVVAIESVDGLQAVIVGKVSPSTSLSIVSELMNGTKIGNIIHVHDLKDYTIHLGAAGQDAHTQITQAVREVGQ